MFYSELSGFCLVNSSNHLLLQLKEIISFSFQDGWDAGFLYECEFPKAQEVVDENEAKLMEKFGQKPVDEKADDESVVAIKIPDINDVPITALNFRYVLYVIFIHFFKNLTELQSKSFYFFFLL